MQIRDRIKDFRRVSAKLLKPNPKNWRVHNNQQRNILKGILAEVGYADALLARELPDGSLQLIDGHLRAETTPQQQVPVLVLDVNEDEANKLLAIIDPLAGLAGTDERLLDELIEQIESENVAVQDFLKSVYHGVDEVLKFAAAQPPPSKGETLKVPELYQILITCQDEAEQREIFERLMNEGRKCRLVNLG